MNNKDDPHPPTGFHCSIHYEPNSFITFINSFENSFIAYVVPQCDLYVVVAINKKMYT